MTAPEICQTLETTFGDRIKSKKLDVLDPFVVVEPKDLVEVCRFLRDDSRLKFELLSCISGVDYFEPDPKKAPKAGFEPHLEVVYHLQSIENVHRFTIKVVLPRWKDGVAGQLPEVPSVTGIWNMADWHEREVYDLSGVWFTGHPEIREILYGDYRIIHHYARGPVRILRVFHGVKRMSPRLFENGQ